MELTQVATIICGATSNILTSICPRSCKINCGLHKIGPVGLINGHKQHGPNISFVDWYCLIVSGVIYIGLMAGLRFSIVSKNGFSTLNIGHLTKAMPLACRNVSYIAKLYSKDDHSGEGMSLDEVI